METTDQMIERHRKEMGEFMKANVNSWDALRETYGGAQNIPPHIFAEWQGRYGPQAEKALAAQHAAEIAAYPQSPIKSVFDEIDQKSQAEIIARHEANKSTGQQKKSVFDEIDEDAAKRPNPGLHPKL